jgi:peptidoglycan/xylan/chitin deacetylase (PgdA/CDA1 family)
MTRTVGGLRRARRVSLALLVGLAIPASLVPIALGGRHTISAFSSLLERDSQSREPLPAPPITLTPNQLATWKPLPANRNAVPVLTYHGVNKKNDEYSVSQHSFAEQMAMLKHAGFTSISMEQFARFRRGDLRGMPARPVLITFDDSRFDSFQGADAVLRKYGFRATMFVISGWVGRYRFYSTWHELRKMKESGRWDLQEHSGKGHYDVPYNAKGDRGSYYAYRKWIAASEGQPAHLESLEAYKQRVTQDLTFGARKLEQETGSKSYAFASPYGNVGQHHTNDRRIPPFLGGWLARHYNAIFLADWPRYTTRRTPHDHLRRFEVHTTTPTDAVYHWLRARRPGCSRGRC